MKFKSFIFIITLLFFFFIFSACSAENSDYPNDPDLDDDQTQETAELSVPNRKIIYKVNTYLYVNDLDETVQLVRQSINAEEEWFDSEYISEDYAIYVLRIKTTRLDEFIEDLYDMGEVERFEKTGKDVSLAYSNTANKILSLQAERDRLVVLYANASMSEMININSKIAAIDLEIGKLTADINQFDSLINYSEVTIKIYPKESLPERLPFGSRVSRAFNGGFNALKSIFEVVVIALSALLPFIVILGTIGSIIFIINRYQRKHRKQ